jgi:hypothetical protein
MTDDFRFRRERQFEEYLRDGITAAKAGNHKLAQSLLNRASIINGLDARPYIWLSVTTNDPEEQKRYLEKAYVIDPHNIAARRGLAILSGKIDSSRVNDFGENQFIASADDLVSTRGNSILCPKCGGRMTFSTEKKTTGCEYCGYMLSEVDLQEHDSIADRAEQILDFVMPTTNAHHWLAGQQRLVCDSCGAVSILPKTIKSRKCAYCGSHQLSNTDETQDLIDPHVILLVKIDHQEAIKRLKNWMGEGMLTVDNLVSVSKKISLKPAYYSCWTFDGIYEVNWSCVVQVGQGGSEQWQPRSGVQSKIFNDILISGVVAIDQRDLEKISPFDLKDVKEFQPEYVAGWSTILYDRSISDASIIARKIINKEFHPILYHTTEIGYQKRDFQITYGRWADMTYKHILIPIWVGTYQYQGKKYHVLINGQTGKIYGDKPSDSFKIVFLALMVFMGLFLFVMIILIIMGIKHSL